MPDGTSKHSPAAQVLIERLPSAMLIAAASAASYWLAHAYETAFLGYFGLPASLVRVSTNTTILAAGAVLSVVWAAFTAAAIVGEWLRALKLDNELLVACVVMLFRGVAGLYISFRDWNTWAWQLGGVAVLLLGVWGGRAWIKRRAKRNPGQGQSTVQASKEAGTGELPVPATVISPGVARALVPWIGREGVMLVVVLFLAQGVAQDAGRAAAKNGSAFFTLLRHVPYVVLRAYDDELIAVSLDRERKCVGRDVLLVPVSKQGEINLRWEVVGPLHRLADDTSAPTAAPAVAQGSEPTGDHSARPSLPCQSCHAG
jgi:hypothetical protein